MFETFNVANFYLASTSALSLISSGKTTGVILESGYETTHSVPVFEGFKVKHAVKSNYIGGKNVTQNLAKLMLEIGFNFCTSAEIEILDDIK